MAETVLIGDLELSQVTDIHVHQSRKLAAHAIAGWDGDLLQDLGERSALIEIRGIAFGADASQSLEDLRRKFSSGEPQDFVSSASVATDVEQTLLEHLNVVQSGRLAESYVYSMTLRRYVPPPPASIGGFTAGFLEDLTSLDSALGADAAGGFADALGTAQGALDSAGKILEAIEEAGDLIDGAMDLKELIAAASNVIKASD